MLINVIMTSVVTFMVVGCLVAGLGVKKYALILATGYLASLAMVYAVLVQSPYETSTTALVTAAAMSTFEVFCAALPAVVVTRLRGRHNLA